VRVLVVEDHPPTRSLVESALKGEGHTVESAPSLGSARERLAGGGFAVIVLDWMLPDGAGPDLCREMRASGNTTPVLILTAKTDVEDRVAGLDAGADDYLKKPFAVAELRARVRALLRRGPQIEDPLVRIGPVEIRTAARLVLVDGAEVPVTAKEFDILEVLARHAGRAVSRSAILLAVWGTEDEAAGASLEVLIARLRRKISDAGGPDLIRTHRGFGYALRVEG
jgi:DNA-binding response OmpR family regulator